MANPETPPIATFPVPPPVPRFRIVDEHGLATIWFQQWCQLMWAAIQGKFGLIDEVDIALFSEQNTGAETLNLIQSHLAIPLEVQGLLNALAKELDYVKLVAFSAGTANTSASSSATDTSWVPVTDGAEPPTLISDGAGQLIFVAWHP